jgi:hypothetical protein
VKIGDFARYLRTVGASLAQYEAVQGEAPAPRQSTDGAASTPTKARPPDGLAQAMTEVPLQYFRQDFSLDWDLLGPIDTPEEQQAVVEELSAQLVSHSRTRKYPFAYMNAHTRPTPLSLFSGSSGDAFDQRDSGPVQQLL